MAALNETRNAVHYEAAGITSQGLLLKHSTDGVLLADAKGDEVCGVSAAESSRDADSALEDGTAVTATVAVYPLSGIVYIKFGETLSTLDFGAKIYVDDSVDGHCTHNLDSSGKHLGYYFGESNISLASGDLIPVACGRWG
mgnify:FL=1